MWIFYKEIYHGATEHTEKKDKETCADVRLNHRFIFNHGIHKLHERILNCSIPTSTISIKTTIILVRFLVSFRVVRVFRGSAVFSCAQPLRGE